MNFRTVFFIAINVLLFFLTTIVGAQDSVLLHRISVLEDSLPKVDLKRKAAIQLQLSEIYWRVRPEQGIEYGKLAIGSYDELDDDKIANAYVNTAIGYYYCGEMDSCIYYVEQMLELEDVLISDRKKGVSYNILCVANRRIGAYQQALYSGEKAIEYFTLCGDSIQISGTLDNISLIYRKWGRYEDALKYSLKSLKIFEDKKDTAEMAATIFNIGNLYFDLGDNRNAKKYFVTAQRMAISIGNLLLEADVYDMMGSINQQENDLDSAWVYYKKSLLLYQKIDFKQGVAIAQQNIGTLQVKLKNYRYGISYLKKSLAFFQTTNLIEDVSKVAIDLSKAYTHTQEYDSAVFYSDYALKNGRSLQNVDIQLQALEELESVYLNMKNYGKAYDIQSSYYKLRDSLQSVDMEMRIAELKQKYDLDKAEKETALWMSQQQIEASKSKVYMILVVSLLSFILFASIFVWHRRKKETEIIQLRQERNKLIKEDMEDKMRFQSKQLTTHALNMLQKNTLLQSLQEDIDRIGEKAKEEVKPELRSLNHKIMTHIKGEKDWGLFKMYFEQINKDFFNALYKINPNLTSNDLRLLALIKLNMNIKEVASVLNLSPDSVKNARYRLRKKLNLNSQDDLFEFVNNIS